MHRLGICLFTAASLFAADANTSQWNSQSAAKYLDGRMAWWTTWPTAARDHDTFCVSCHTVLPYALARPALHTALSETAPSANERKLLDNVTKRVRMWKEVEPFYPDATRGVPKTAESRGTESILNAVVLTSLNAPDAQLALDNMWSEQLKSGDAKGAWNWLEFHNSPWEGESQYFGATLAAIASKGKGPAENLQALKEYLVGQQSSQVLINRMMLLWASAKTPGLLTAAQQKSLAEEALSKQQSDGGFSLSSFVGDWKRHDKTPLETRSDGYATAVVVYVLEQTGFSRDPRLKPAIAWLQSNQDRTEGRWLAYSLNKERDLASDAGRFMSDAATAFAVLALTGANQ